MKKIVIYYFVFLLSIFSFLSSGVIDSQDGFQYLAVARNIYYTGKPISPPYEYDIRKNIHMNMIKGKDGNNYSLTGLGFSLAYLPAVAITDLVYKFYGVSPPVHFPLENDWLIFLTASFTNGFFASILGIIIFLYLLELGLSKKQALFISLIGLFATNLFVYAKHSFPHMMFITFLFLSFYLIKIYFKTKKKILLILSGISFGVNCITYNQTFNLGLLPLVVYILVLMKFKLGILQIRYLSLKLLLFFIGLLPFLLIYYWFEGLRSTQSVNFSSPAAASDSVFWLLRVPKDIFLEGIYGQLFSPGRSIFLYSPILLVILFFWHKIKKVIFPEVLIFIVISLIYILFYSTVYIKGGLDQGITGFWHGESSWGPRYLTTLIPFGMLIAGYIYTQLKKREQIFVIFPLILLGFYVEILGVVMPYQIKLHDLEQKFFLNGTEYTNFLYSNLLPRYSPILQMSKKLVKLAQNLPKTLDHGRYNVRFYDGVDFPFPVGGERWRVIEGRGYISFDNLDKDPVKKLTFGMINHPVADSTSSAKLSFILNNTLLNKEPLILNLRERKVFSLLIEAKLLKNKKNELIINVEYEDQTIVKNNAQILGLIAFMINDTPINLESIDVPYVSSFGGSLMNVKYMNWGGINVDPWKTWNIHTQIYERVPDFWWFKFLYYWDIPKGWVIALLILNLLGFFTAGIKLKNILSNE